MFRPVDLMSREHGTVAKLRASEEHGRKGIFLLPSYVKKKKKVLLFTPEVTG